MPWLARLIITAWLTGVMIAHATISTDAPSVTIITPTMMSLVSLVAVLKTWKSPKHKGAVKQRLTHLSYVEVPVMLLRLRCPNCEAAYIIALEKLLSLDERRLVGEQAETEVEPGHYLG